MPRRRPLVEEVSDGLRELISSGKYRLGDQLPDEDEMSRRFEVSRATVREAYRGLIEAGYVVRRRGAGTFVARSPQRHALDLNVSYTEMIRAAGFTPSITVLGTIIRPAGDVDATYLEIPPTDDVIEVERLRLADERPVVYSVDRVPAALIPEEQRGSGLGESLYSMLDSLSHGVRNGRALIKPVIAKGASSKYLSVAPGSALLYFEETDYDESGHPVLASYEWHTSDVFDMWINRKAVLGAASAA